MRTDYSTKSDVAAEIPISRYSQMIQLDDLGDKYQIGNDVEIGDVVLMIMRFRGNLEHNQF